MKSTLPGIMNIQVQCPACGSEMETTLAAARAGLKCAECGTGFVPEKAVPATAPAPQDSDLTRSLTRHAASVTAVAKLLAGLAGLLVILAIFSAADDSSFARDCLLGSVGMGFWAVLLGILAQLMHIRAALTDRRKG